MECFFSNVYHEVPHGCVGASGGLDGTLIINPSFGYAHNFRDFLLWVSKYYKKPSKEFIINEQTLIELYQTFYKIHDFTDTSNPLKSVGLHPYLANSYKDDLYDNRLREFIGLKIHEKTGLSFDEYMNKPRHEIMRIDRICEEYTIAKNSQEEKDLADMKRKTDKDKKEADKQEKKSRQAKI